MSSANARSSKSFAFDFAISESLSPHKPPNKALQLTSAPFAFG